MGYAWPPATEGKGPGFLVSFLGSIQVGRENEKNGARQKREGKERENQCTREAVDISLAK